MKHRRLTGLAVVPLTLAMLTAGPAGAASGVRVTTLSGAQGWRVSPSNAGGGARAQAQLPLDGSGTAPEQNGDLTPGVPGKAGGGFAARVRQPVAVEMAAEVSRPARQAADSVALLAGGMVLAASAAFAGTGMVRRRKVRR
jgi:hypothetical protein